MGLVLGIIVGPVDPARGAVGDLVDDFATVDIFQTVHHFFEVSGAAAGASLGVQSDGVEMDGIAATRAAAGEWVKLPVAAGDDDVAPGGFFPED